MDSEPSSPVVAPPPRPPVTYFDGKSSRRRAAALTFSEELGINELPDAGMAQAPKTPKVRWPYADIRRTDAPTGILRVSCVSAPSLARLEIRDAAIAAKLAERCLQLDENSPNRRGVAVIVAWSLAAAVSIVSVVLFGVPLVADRLAPLIPPSMERRLGDVAERQIKIVFGKVCENPSGQAAFTKLVNAVREPAGLDTSVRSAVLASQVPNAFALPGGSVFLFDGLLQKANNPDEIAGVLAHELGHLRHRDVMRNLIYSGGTSFLAGLFFGDVTGAGALIFASRSMMTASYTREAEINADTFSIDIMHQLGRSPEAMGELLFRVTGKQGGTATSILSNHPLTEDRLERMKAEDRPVTGPPLLTDAEWINLKNICKNGFVVKPVIQRPTGPSLRSGKAQSGN